ncbi:MAG: nucleotidyltransferase family protein, partial [Armatimonadetes bacterium]|nr:nucleotidyltransferase family protein [Armatimonadota bacterium]
MALAQGATLQADAALGFWRTGQSALPPETLIRWARAQRLLLLLPWRAQQRGWRLPAPLLVAARQEGYATAAWQARALRALRTLGALAQAMEAPAVIVKGPLAAEAYPDPLLRPYGDLDLLIRPQDAGRWLDAFTARGYRPHVEGGRATHLPALLPPTPGPRLELQITLDPAGRFAWSRWEASARSWPTVPGLLQPDPGEHWLYLVYHMVERHSLQFGLGSLADLAFGSAGWGTGRLPLPGGARRLARPRTSAAMPAPARQPVSSPAPPLRWFWD